MVASTYPLTPFIIGMSGKSSVYNSTTVWTNDVYGGPTQGIPMGWYPPDLTPEEKIEKAKEVKVQQVKGVKRHVLGPKRSRWG